MIKIWEENQNISKKYLLRNILFQIFFAESSLCDIDPEYQSPCGSLGIDRFNCEAQGCCFTESDEDGHTVGYSCFKKQDPCSDRTIECNLHKQNGLCESEERKMSVDCPFTCGYCEKHNGKKKTCDQFLTLKKAKRGAKRSLHRFNLATV